MGRQLIGGIDEAGRGAWAGPVVASCVVLTSEEDGRYDDSKKLSLKQRELLYEHIMHHHEVGVGVATAKEVDELGIKKATHMAMQRALFALTTTPSLLRIDGNDKFTFPISSEDVVRGDSKHQEIAAASIIAKVHSDRMMVEYGTQYAGYGFEEHKGYGTKVHQEAISQLGPCEIHRMSYRPIAQPTLFP